MRYPLIAFDVDGTLVGSADGRVVWQHLNNHFAPDETAEARRFEAYLEGQITYPEWVDLDVGQWVRAGARRSEIAHVITKNLYLLPGAREATETLRARGHTLAVISGTLDLVLELLFPDHPFSEVFTNAIWFDDKGAIDGWRATPYDMEGKAEALGQIARRHGISLEQTAYVGDNINDIQVMGAAGVAVAFEPKGPEVAEAADHVINEDLRNVLDLI